MSKAFLGGGPGLKPTTTTASSSSSSRAPPPPAAAAATIGFGFAGGGPPSFAMLAPTVPGMLESIRTKSCCEMPLGGRVSGAGEVSFPSAGGDREVAGGLFPRAPATSVTDGGELDVDSLGCVAATAGAALDWATAGPTRLLLAVLSIDVTVQ